jgi:hypothetical protein
MFPAITLPKKYPEQCGVVRDLHSLSEARVDGRRQHVAEPDSGEAEHQRKHTIRAGPEPLTVLCQCQSLQTERRKSGVAAADAEHEELTERWGHQPAPFRAGGRREQSYDERATDIYEQRAPRESFAYLICNQPGSAPPGQAAEPAAYKNPQCIPHNSNRAAVAVAGRSYQH